VHGVNATQENIFLPAGKLLAFLLTGNCKVKK
jgi:hypothetical protein